MGHAEFGCMNNFLEFRVTLAFTAGEVGGNRLLSLVTISRNVVSQNESSSRSS